jgi:hypothetical protein
MTWYYKDIEVTELPDTCVGFVYLITNLTNDRKYIGKKLAKFSKTKIKTITLKSGEKKKKKIKSKVDSDWLEYYGSSIELSLDVSTLGQDKFKREILYFCSSKAASSYLEAKEQMLRNVLESNDYYNNNIMIRVHGNHIRDKALIISPE